MNTNEKKLYEKEYNNKIIYTTQWQFYDENNILIKQFYKRAKMTLNQYNNLIKSIISNSKEKISKVFISYSENPNFKNN